MFSQKISHKSSNYFFLREDLFSKIFHSFAKIKSLHFCVKMKVFRLNPRKSRLLHIFFGLAPQLKLINPKTKAAIFVVLKLITEKCALQKKPV
jgi:hypothetical protein